MSLAQKQPFRKNINSFAENKFAALQQILKKALPATVVDVDETGTIATVQFEVDSQFTLPTVKMPIHGPEFVRWPLKKGAKGVVMSSDVALGGMSGLGEGVATLTPMFNLSSGVFIPIGNTGFDKRADGEDSKTVIYGPDGVVIKSITGKKSALVVDKDGIKSLGTGDQKGSYTLVDDTGFKVYIGGTLKFAVDAGGVHYYGSAIPGGGNYGINVTDTGTHIDNINFLPHVHQSVQPGSGNSGTINTTLSPHLANEP